MSVGVLRVFGCAWIALVWALACGGVVQPYTWAVEHPSLRHGDTAYLLGPEDRISVFVTGQESLSGEHVISPDGVIVQPLLGALKLSGISTQEAQKLITTRLSVYINSPQVSVTLLEARKLRVNALGELKQPGQYVVSADETVLDVLGRAGGLTDFADENAIYVVRRVTGERLRFRYGDLTQPDITAKFRLQNGDSVIVQ